jgi:hypothetical protein
MVDDRSMTSVYYMHANNIRLVSYSDLFMPLFTIITYSTRVDYLCFIPTSITSFMSTIFHHHLFVLVIYKQVLPIEHCRWGESPCDASISADEDERDAWYAAPGNPLTIEL